MASSAAASAGNRLLVKAGLYLGAVAFLALGSYAIYLHGKAVKADKLVAQKIVETAAGLGASKVEAARAKAVIDDLTESNRKFVQQLRDVDKRVQPVLHIDTRAKAADVVILGPEEGRFKLSPDLKSLTRRQAFRLDVVVVRNVDGKVGPVRVDLLELDPDTAQVLPTNFTFESHVQVVDGLLNPVVSVLHPRVVAGIETRGFPVAGVELLNGERFSGFFGHTNLSLFGGYNTRDKTPFGGAAIAYRPFNWNVSFGPAAFYGSTKWSFGAVAAIELTR